MLFYKPLTYSKVKCKNEEVWVSCTPLKASRVVVGIPGLCFKNHCIIIFLKYLWLLERSLSTKIL